MFDAAAVVEAILEKERVIARAHAEQAELIAALHEHWVMVPEEQDLGRTMLDRKDMVEAELSAALHVSSRIAGNRIEVALALTQRLPGTLAALREGGLDWFRASIVVEETHAVAVAAAHAVREAGGSPAAEAQAAAAVCALVEDRVLGTASGQTPSRLRASLKRAVIAVDPAAAEDRCEVAARERRAVFTPMPDAMAELCFTLPAPEAAAVWNRLDHDARVAHAAGDPRTLDQLRVDSLVGLAAGGEGSVTRRAKAHVLVTVAADTLLELDDEPGDLDGYGPIPAGLARRIAARDDATWRRLLTDPATGVLLDYGRTTYTPPAALADFVIARDRTCTFPSCNVPATRCDLDHVIPYPAGPTSAENLHPQCRRHHRLKHHGRWRVTEDGTWTSPTGRRYPD